MNILRKNRIFYGWYIVAASVVMNAYITVAFGLGFNVFFLPILTEFGWSRAVTSGAFSLRSLESGLLAPIIGFLVDRWGPRPIILIGVFLVGSGMIMMAYIDSLWGFYAAFLIAALGGSGAGHGVSWVVAVAKWFNRMRGRALGIAMLGPVIGGPLLFTIAIIDEYFGWRIATLILGVGVWIIGLPLALVARTEPRAYGYFPDNERTIDDPKTQPELDRQYHSGMSVSEALMTRDFWVLTILFALMFLGISGLMVHLIPLLEDFAYSSTEAATILGILFLLSGLGRVFSGFMADSLDYRKVLIILVLCQLLGLLILTRLSEPNIWIVFIFTLTFGIGFGGTIPLRPFVIMQIFGGKSFGALQGLLQVGAIGAGVVGPVFYGWIFDTTGSYDIALYATMATIAITIPLTNFLHKPVK